MSYEHRSNVQSKRFPLPIIIVIIIVILIMFLYFIFPQFLPSLFSKITLLFWKKADDSREMTLSLKLENSLIMELQNENYELKRILGRNMEVGTSTEITIKNNSNQTIGYILKKPPYTVYDTFIIDIGAENNIKKGEKVYAVGNMLIGEIGEVNNATSKVKLYSSYGEKYDVLIGDNILATALGRGGGSFEVTLPRDVKIKKNDIVTVPSLDVSVFGVIDNIISDPSKTFTTVLFSQPVNIYELKYILVKNK